jgi:hypothetical protein
VVLDAQPQTLVTPILTASKATASAFELPLRFDGSNAWSVRSAKMPGRPLSIGCSSCGGCVRAPQVAGPASMQTVAAAKGMAPADRRVPRRTGR